MMKTIKFKKGLIAAVLNNEKTVTRRPVKEITKKAEVTRIIEDGYNFELIQEKHNGKEILRKTVQPKYNQGDFVLIEGTNIIIKITNVKLDFLRNITDEEAIKEGLECKDHFFYVWDSIYKDTIYSRDYNPFVWVYEFEKVRSK